MADFFIKRPILSICLSVIIVLLGAFSILRLPISEYPDIIPPSIQGRPLIPERTVKRWSSLSHPPSNSKCPAWTACPT